MTFQSDPDQLTAGTYAGFVEELLEGGFDGAFGKLEPCGDFFVTEAFEDAAEDGTFAGGKRVRGKRDRCFAASSGD